MPTLNHIRRIGAAALDLLYPRKCVGCGSVGAFLCDRCIAESPRAADTTGAGLQLVLAPFEMKGAAQKAVHRLKYNGVRGLAAPMGAAMAQHLQRHGVAPDVIVPVPLHKSRQRERGYNQAELLARAVGRWLENARRCGAAGAHGERGSAGAVGVAGGAAGERRRGFQGAARGHRQVDRYRRRRHHHRRDTAVVRGDGSPGRRPPGLGADLCERDLANPAIPPPVPPCLSGHLVPRMRVPSQRATPGRGAVGASQPRFDHIPQRRRTDGDADSVEEPSPLANRP